MPIGFNPLTAEIYEQTTQISVLGELLPSAVRQGDFVAAATNTNNG